MKSLVRRISALLICFALLCPFSASALSVEISETPSAPALTQNQINIAARGDYMYGLTWVCQKTVTAHAYSSYYTYYAGSTYRMPYGQAATSHYIGYGVTPEKFLEAAADVNSIFYTQKSTVSTWYSTYYIQDCSGFVSWCWGLTAKQSTRSIADVSTYIASVTTSNIKNYLRVGDAINRYDYHVVLVTDITYDSAGNMTAIEITEQTIPETKRTVFTPAGLAAEYASYNGIYRYYGTVPAAPASVTTTHKLEGNDPVDMGKDFYARVKHTASGKYVADVGGSVYATDLSGGNEQVWHFMRQSSGAYLVGNSGTSKFWEIKGASYKDGTPLVTNSATFENNQMFYIYYLNNNFHFMPAGGDKVVDVNASNFITQIYGDTTGGDDQVAVAARAFNLEIISIHDGTKSYANLGESFQAKIKNASSGKLVTATGNTIVGADAGKADNQKWNFTRMPNGAYTMVSQSENLAVDIPGAAIAEGTAVNLYSPNRTNAQCFFLIEKNGKYYIKSTYTLNALSMDASSLKYTMNPTSEDADKLAAQLFEITIIPEGETELIIKDGSSYSESGTNLLGVALSQTVSAFLENFDNTTAVVLDANGAELDSTAIVGTGCEVVIAADGEKLDALTVVIAGDVTGDGIISATDVIAMRNVLKTHITFTGAYLEAADLNADEMMSSLDYVHMVNVIKKRY